MPDWEQWQGELVAGTFPLERLLAAGPRSAVFRTRLPSGAAALKLVPAGTEEAARLIEQWNRAAALNGPHLIGISKTGTWEKAGMPLAYFVMEYADENLSSVLLERALTPGETLEMLQPVAEAVAFLHSKGFVHGRLKASNIFAVNDMVKISSDSISPGDATEDARALGALMIHALTQSGISNADRLPEPFQEIAQNCAGLNGRPQWSAAEVAARLKAEREPARAIPVTAAKRKKFQWAYPIVAAVSVVAVITIGTWLRNRTPLPTEPVANTAPATPTPVKQAPEPSNTVNPPAVTRAHQAPPQPRGAVIDSQRQVVREVLPNITDKARRTVHGKVAVFVRVSVDQTGNVTNATLQPTNSHFFGKLAVEAARNWKFIESPSDASRSLLLRFDITPADINVFVEK
jgi:TonB family protein